MTMTDNPCQGCGYRITWADQRRQFGRAIRHGLTADEAKALMPRCQKCLTEKLFPKRLRKTVEAEKSRRNKVAAAFGAFGACRAQNAPNAPISRFNLFALFPLFFLSNQMSEQQGERD